MMTNMLRPFENIVDSMWGDLDRLTLENEFPTNIIESDDCYTIEMAVPGMERKNFHIKEHNGVLDLRICKGHRFYWPWQKNHVYVHCDERLRIPICIDTDKISANVINGILYIRLPKKESYVSDNSNGKGEESTIPIMVA